MSSAMVGVVSWCIVVYTLPCLASSDAATPTSSPATSTLTVTSTTLTVTSTTLTVTSTTPTATSTTAGCVACSPGEYSPYECLASCGSGSCPRDVACQKCVNGTFQPGSLRNASSGGGFCVMCPYGHYCPQEGCPLCLTCPAGKDNYVYGSSQCYDCPAGKFKAVRSSETCQPCPVGYFSDRRGSLKCDYCPAGFFCPEAWSSPVKCSGDQVCPAGTVVPGRCRSLVQTPDRDNKKCMRTSGYYVVIVLPVALLMCLALFCVVKFNEQLRRVTRARGPTVVHKRDASAVAGGTEQQVLLPDDATTGPVYSGF